MANGTPTPPPEATPEQPPSVALAPPNDWPTRVLALVPLVALALLWSSHHLGVAAGHPALMAAIAAALPVALGLITKLLDKADQESLSATLRDRLAGIVTWRLLLVLYLALSVIALTWTSVVVLAEDGGRLGRVTLLALDDRGGQADEVTPWQRDDPGRFVVPTQPFGRLFRLDVEGYVPQTVEVYPPLGLRVQPGRDLRRSPSVLLRFTEAALGSWRDSGGAELRLMLVKPDGTEVPVLVTQEPAGALLVGREQPVPVAWSADWRAELLAAQFTDESMIARHLVAWKRPRVHAPAAALEPGMKLRATLTNAQHKVVARAEFVLRKDALQDETMEDVE